MITRQISLGLNVAIYGSVVALVAGHAWFWGVWLRSTDKRDAALASECIYLEASVADARKATAELQRSINHAEAEIRRREKELVSLGSCFPNVRDRKAVIHELLVAIEAIGIKIEGSNFPEGSGASPEGYIVADVDLDLVGSYDAFKQFLAKVPLLPKIVRILSFQVQDYGDATSGFDWKVHVQLQTYFTAKN
jgi:Tfp pilus assembly protein PilO